MASSVLFALGFVMLGLSMNENHEPVSLLLALLAKKVQCSMFRPLDRFLFNLVQGGGRSSPRAALLSLHGCSCLFP